MKKGAALLLFFQYHSSRLAAEWAYRSMPLWRRSELTVNFFRPFWRRELKTLRPLAEDMRLRKPCLLRRLRTEGWKVLFISLHYFKDRL
jgi:hypothetical protein